MNSHLLTLGADFLHLQEDGNRFSDVYLQLRKKFMVQRYSPPKNEQLHEPEASYLKDKNPAPTLTEKHLRAVWYDGKFEHRNLKLVDGRKISIVSPGVWNSGEGPDFKDAELRIENQILRGDVEVHLRSSDWHQHGHSRDPKYNQVILHLVLFHNLRTESVQNREGKKVPQLELKDALSGSWETLAKTFEVEGYPYKSNALLGECGKAMGLPGRIHLEKYDAVQLLFRLAGDSRILLKGEPYQNLTKKSDLFEQLDRLLYSKIVEGLGYSQNKAAMKELAGRVSYDFMKRSIQRTSGEMRTLRIQAILFGAAGLIPMLSSSFDDETTRFVSALSFEWNEISSGIEPMKKSQWLFRGLRPHNFPTRRLAGLSYFLAEHMEKGLFLTALEIVRNWEKPEKTHEAKIFSQRFEQVQKFLFQSGWGYFGVHANFGGNKFLHKVALIGEERSLTIWVNAILPFLVRWCRENKKDKLEEELYCFWKRIQTLSNNNISKMMLHRLLGSRGANFSVEKEQTQQGLIQLFQDFCDTKPTACIGCPFPRLVSLTIPELLRG